MAVRKEDNGDLNPVVGSSAKDLRQFTFVMAYIENLHNEKVSR
jgi:hypothetical protein